MLEALMVKVAKSPAVMAAAVLAELSPLPPQASAADEPLFVMPAPRVSPLEVRSASRLVGANGDTPKVFPVTVEKSHVKRLAVAAKLDVSMMAAVPMTMLLVVVAPLPPRIEPAERVTVPEPRAPVVAALTTPAETLTAPE